METMTFRSHDVCDAGRTRPRWPRRADRARAKTSTDTPTSASEDGRFAPAARSVAGERRRRDDRRSLPPNHMGRIPVLEYHVIGGEKNALYTRTVASFKADLEDVYKRGYRPITIAQMLDKNFADVPAGMSPVVFVFDDASPEQFRYIEGADGKLTIDPTSGVGIWVDFAKTHPGWKNRGTFCLLNGASAGHNFFGDSPKFHGQKKEWRFQKVKWLADQGFELCDHTVWHAMLNKYQRRRRAGADRAQHDGDRLGGAGLQGAHDGAAVRHLAEESRSSRGKDRGPIRRPSRRTRYKFDAVLEVAGGPTRSPYDPQFNPHRITRIEAIGNDIAKTLDGLDKTKTRFVK